MAWAEVATANAKPIAINLIIVISNVTFQERSLGGGVCARPASFNIADCSDQRLLLITRAFPESNMSFYID
jgi:hypothetical protein